ncbi:Pkinase-domain-containing protein, partial [Ramicandelaber brevisporus]
VVNGKQYARLDTIGRGGSSTVFRVQSELDGNIYALKKVQLYDVDSMTLQGYLNERDLLQKLSGNDYIIKLIDSEDAIRSDPSTNSIGKRTLYLVMELGETDLARYLDKHRRERAQSIIAAASSNQSSIDNQNAINNQQQLQQSSIPPQAPLELAFIQKYWKHMLLAVQAIHDSAIVHSDLKPANFVLVNGTLKLIDFGIAKAIPSDTTNISRESQIGTVSYMSPEALRDLNNPLPSHQQQQSSTNNQQQPMLMKLGRASDVWSLGCILYMMVYGRTPFAHLQNTIQRLRAISDPNFQITFPDLIEKVPNELKDVLIRCLDRESKQRATIPELLKHPFL